MPIPEGVNVRSTIEVFQTIAAFAKAFEDARAVFDALLRAEGAIAEIDKEIASRRVELEQLRAAESTAVLNDAETQRDSMIASARQKAAEILKDARREHDVYSSKTSALAEKYDQLRRQIENIQASVSQFAR